MAEKKDDQSTAGNAQSGNPGNQAGPTTGGAGAGTTRESGFVHASPESNVGPAGAPQNSHGFAGRPVPGGSEGKAGPGESGPGNMGAAAAGGNPGTSAGTLPPGQSVQHADGGASSARSNDVEDDTGVGGSAGSESR